MAAPDTTTEGPAAVPTKISKWDRPPQPKDWRYWVGGIGKVLIATGLLMFAFVGYQLWGTGIETARAQNALEDDFNALLASTVPVSTVPPTTVPVDTAPAVTLAPETATTTPPSTTTAPVPVEAQNLPPIEEGDVIARLEIPSIGVDNYVVAGVGKSDLKKGPGHYPETPLPGQLGNAAIAGHRTTYGQPFYDIDQVTPGDEIIVTTPAGRFVYIATGQQIVGPNDYQVVATTDPTVATLTLTSCHPRYTARERIVITSEFDPTQSDPVGESLLNYGRPLEPADGNATARLDDPTVSAPVSTAVATPTISAAEPSTSEPATTEPETTEPATTEPVSTESVTTDPATTDPAGGVDAPIEPTAVNDGIADAFADGWFSDPDADSQVALWGAILILISVGAYLVSRKARRDSVGLLIGIVPFTIALYFFFQNVNRLLPPGL